MLIRSRRRIRATLSISIFRLMLFASLLLTAFVGRAAAAAITFVQANSAIPQSSVTSVAIPFTAAQSAGNLNVVVVGWNNSTATISTVVDSTGNVYALAAVPVVQSGTASQAIYYAKNIVSAGAGANTVTVTFGVAAAFPDVRIAEYSGLDTANPLDVSAGAQGTSATSDSGSVTTTSANDLLIGANIVQSVTTGAGTGYTSRLITGDGDILEDRIVSAAGSYNATAALDKSQAWIMQMVAFRAASSAPTPTISSLNPTVGPVGASVTITGTNFGSSQGTSTVTFNNTSATPTSWSATSIVVPVPSGATSGSVVVTVGGVASNAVNFTVGAAASIAFAQSNSGTFASSVTSAPVSYAGAQSAGDLNVVVVGWNDSTATVSSVTDTVGNIYILAVGPTVQAGTATQSIYYAKNIAAAAAGANTVTVAFSTSAFHPDVRIAEYSGLDTLNPFDAGAGAQSTTTSTSDSGPATTTSANDLLVGGNTVQSTTTAAGTGFTSRGITSFGDILEDEIVSSTGTYDATAVLDKVQPWIMQLAAFRAAIGSGTTPNIATLSPSSGSVGTSVTISGSNFGSSQGSSTVKFNGVAGTPSSWGAGAIVVPVPNGATSGGVIVTVIGVASNSVNFAVTSSTPSISSLTPNNGAVGTSVTITGANFGASQGGSAVTFNNTAAAPTSWSASSIIVPVPTGATSGSVVVTVGGQASNGVNFIVPAIIGSLTPNSGAVGTSITIAGSNFGASQGSSTVTFNNTTATPTGWTATSIVVPVPTGATSGNVVVTVSGIASNGMAFTVPPTITSLAPNSGPTGTSVTISGANFGASQGSSTVTFNNTAAAPTSWSATSIVVPVPATATSGNVVVTVGGFASNAVNFSVTPPAPSISSLTPNSGAVGTSVAIAGANFGASQGSSTVTFNSTPATPTAWSVSSITVTVPSGATTGSVVVTVGGQASNGSNFTVAPSITSLTPNNGSVGTSVTIAGANFGASQGSSTVTFNNTAATPTTWTGSSIVVPVPSGATTGNVVVTVGGQASNPSNFTVTTGSSTITLVQHTSKDAGTTSSSSLAFKSNNTAGNWIAVVIRAGKAGQVFTVTDSHSNTYRKAIQFNQTTDTPNGDTLGIFYAENIAGGANTVTVADSINGSTMRFAIFEYSGLALSNSIDVTSTAQGTNASANSGSVTTSASGDLLLGVVITGAAANFTAGPGYKIEELVPAEPNSKLFAEDQIQAAAGAASATATFTANDSWGAGLAAFKAASGGVASPTISSLTPNSGPVGTSVAISGANFGASQGGSTVTFNSTSATPASWSASSIVVPVPAGATTGNVVVTVGGVMSNAVTFTVTVPPPSISSLTPSSGQVGTSVAIAGANFGASQGGSTVKFNGVTATPTSWSAGSIVSPVPAGATTGNVIVTVGGQASNGVTFTVTVPPPTVSGINPTSGAVGTSVTISGSNFGASQGPSTVTFNNVAATPTSWSAGSIVAPVPNGANTGSVVVTVGGQASNGITFTVTNPGPSLSTLSMTQGPVGATVTITGSAFGASQGSSTVTFNNTVGTPSSWSDTSINVPVPTGATTGNVVVTVNSVASNGLPFTVTPPPVITSLVPGTGPIGTTVTVNGNYFGPTVGTRTSTLSFNGVAARTTSWNNTQIVAPVPAGATTGNVVVNLSGVAGNGVNFIVTTGPSIASLSPTSGAVGTSVTITGMSFGVSQGTSTVTFNNTSATATSWSDTSLTVTVPTGASTGNVVVTVNGVVSNGVSFTVTASAPPLQLIQHRSIDAGSTNSSSLAFASANTAGNWIGVVIRAGKSGQVLTVSDTLHNTYKQAVLLNMTVDADTVAIFYAENIAGGANTVTVSDNISGGTLRYAISEYAGVALSNSLDAAASAQGTSTTPNSGNALTAFNGDLLVGDIVTSDAETFTAGTGYKIEESVPAPPNTKLIYEDAVQNAAGNVSASATLGASDPWGAAIAAFKSASGSSPAPITVSVSPTSASVQSGSGTQAFTASLTNDVQNKGVTWSISGAGCSGAACGSLTNVTTTSITYNGPASVPSPATVTLAATSVADNTKSATAAITVIVGPISVSVSPKRGSITTSQTQQFTGTVFNDPSNSGVTWQVDGNTGGNSTSGTISTTGLFTPGTQPGLHTITATSVANASASASVSFAVTDLQGVYTYHNDIARTGQNLQEYALSPATVTPSTFAQLFSCPVDGYVYAQPLYVANLSINSAIHNVVFIATEHDSVYAFDADSLSCVQLWKTSFLSSGVTTMPWGDTSTNGGSNATNDVFPEIGITSTPVIDPVSGTIYVEAKTKETVGSGCSTGNPCYIHRLHALSIATGAEKLGGPVVISAANFVSVRHFNRPALLLSNGTVYVALGSHGDIPPWYGWVFGYNASTLAQTFVFSTSDATGSTSNGASIWDGGGGPAADASGNVYVVTGNGTYDGKKNFSESVMKLSPTGTLLDWFTPFNGSTLDANDIDMGSAGAIVLPDSVGSTTHQHLALATGKIAILYLLDQTNMGKFNSSTNNDVQEVIPVPPPNTTQLDGGNYGVPAYWNGNIYTTGQSFPLSQFTISNGVIATPQAATSINTFPPRGAVPSVSANGTTNGVVWVMDLSNWTGTGPAILYAYDATKVANTLYTSPASGTGAAAAAVKFTVPTVANGKVYIGGQSSFCVFGLLPN